MTSQPGTVEVQDAPAPQRRFYNPALDGLRFFAFLAVFLYHGFLHTTGSPGARVPMSFDAWAFALREAGRFGVDLFFVLSSYLITKLLLIEKETRGGIDIRSFYVRRVLRIWPLYFAFLGFMLVSQLLGLTKTTGLEWIGFLFFFVNWVAVAQGQLPRTGSILWSVSIEEQFYVSWPWIVSKVSRTVLIALCWGLIGCAVLMRIGLALVHAPYLATWCNTLARLDPIALGAILAASPRVEDWFGSLRRPLLIAILCGVGVVVAEWMTILPGIPLAATQSGLFTVVALLCVCAVGCMLGPRSSRLKVVTWKPIVYMGRISYGLYVFHLTLIGFVFRAGERFGIPGGKLVLVPLAFGATVFVASLSYKFLEHPFLSLKERFARVPSRPGG